MALRALSLCGTAALALASPPNIVIIVSDDLGFNDVGFHGSPQISTPHIDEIASTGVTLNNYHLQPVCSPSRATLMSGRHVIHTGIYMPFAQGTSLRLHLNYTLLPAHLKTLGYSTHMVGKWHLGQNVLAALPTGRGFDTYFGYWSGAEDYYVHECQGAYDLADGTRTAFEYNNSYSTNIWVEKSVDIIDHADKAVPFFLYLAFQNVHWPLEAPEAYLDMFKDKTDGNVARQTVCAMVAIMDEGIGNVTAALKRNGFWENTIVIFSTDNGGPTNNEEGTWSSNFPMRGGKNTLWEGGTRGVAALRGPGVPAGQVSYAKFHISDWMPSLLRVAAGDPTWLSQHLAQDEPEFELGDGMDVWDQIVHGTEVRTEVILEAHQDDQDSAHGNGFIAGDWKVLRFGTIYPYPRNAEAGWVPPPGQDPEAVTYQLPCDPSKQPSSVDTSECTKEYCLFNIKEDPCEYENLASQHPDLVDHMVRRLADYQATAVPSIKDSDCGCEPVIVQGAWRPCDSPDPSGVSVAVEV